MSPDTHDPNQAHEADEGPDGTTRDPGDNRLTHKRWAPRKVKHEPPLPDPFPHSDTAVSQADGAA